jgi:hypothetical protein
MSETLPYVYKYPTDLSGLQPTNQVLTERVRVYSTDRGPFVGVPAYAPFFTHAVSVWDESGRELTEQVDYKAIYLNEDLSQRSPYEVCSALYVTAALPDAETPGHEHWVTMSYRTVGYPYTHMVGTMAALIEALNNDQRAVQWGKVIDMPDAFRPEHHLHPVGDLFGFEHLVQQMEDIRQALTGTYAFNDPNNIPYTQQDRIMVAQALARAAEAKTQSENSEYKVNALLDDLSSVFSEDYLAPWLPGVVKLAGDLDVNAPGSVVFRFTGAPEGALVVLDSPINAWFSQTTGIDPVDTVSLNAAPISPGRYPVATYAVIGGKRTMKYYQTVVVDYG